MNDDELKAAVLGELDVLEFLDLVGMDYAELIDLVFEDLSEESREELLRAVR